ncbi:MAG TPA: hypothetical protein VJM31_04475 [Vicinamibacterales bacterium]|nr:hypothetical protein [Vicinamibacterales bacterium]
MSSTDTLAVDLKTIFGERLKMLVAFGDNSHSCAVVETLTLDDLDRCAGLAPKWQKLNLDAPLFLLEREFERARDAFPLELSEIVATRRVIFGADLFEGVAIQKTDLRRACEVQARGHVLHLREGYIEAAGDRKAVDRLVLAASPVFRALVINAARLDGISPQALASQLGLESFEKGFPEALTAAERLVDYVDRWARS